MPKNKVNILHTIALWNYVCNRKGVSIASTSYNLFTIDSSTGSSNGFFARVDTIVHFPDLFLDD